MRKVDENRTLLLSAIAVAVCCGLPLVVGLLLATGLGAALLAR